MARWTQRQFSVVLLLAIAACATPATGPEHGNSALYGRWRNLSSKVYLSDGTVRVQRDLHCVGEVTEQQIVTDCVLPTGTKTRVVSRIISLDARSYEVECVENMAYPQTVGLRSRTEYRIEGNKRFSTVYPPPVRLPSGGAFAVRLESVDIRD